MKITMAATGRISLMIATAAFGVAVAAAPAAATWSPSSSTNKADIAILGGDAKAVGACFNVAKTYAKLKKTPPKIQSCQNISSAQGGGVVLKDVDVSVIQDASGKGKKLNSADIKIAGGDATAYSACANVLSGTASSKNFQDCAAISDAKGGDVKLSNVDFTVIQTS